MDTSSLQCGVQVKVRGRGYVHRTARLTRSAVLKAVAEAAAADPSAPPPTCAVVDAGPAFFSLWGGHYLSLGESTVRGLFFSPHVVALADKVIAAMGRGGYNAVHLRIEGDTEGFRVSGWLVVPGEEEGGGGAR